MKPIHRLGARFLALPIALAASLATPAMATMPPAAGSLPAELSIAFEDQLFAVPERADGSGTSGSQTEWKIPVLIVSFADSGISHTPEEFERLLFDTTGSTATGSVFDYYQWVSGGRLRVLGRVVDVVTLPNDRAFYAGNAWGLNAIATPNNSFGACTDALRRSRSDIDWSEFDRDHDGYVDMLWVIHAGLGGEASDRSNLWSVTSRLTSGWRSAASWATRDPIPGSSTQFVRVDRFTILPELSSFWRTPISEIGVYCHEFGHALGLPDLYDTVNLSGVVNVGPGNWSLMSSGAYGTDGHSPEYPAHMGAWPLQYLGWDHTIRPTQDGVIRLEPIEGSGSVVEWCFQGEAGPEHFLIENRQRLGFDRNLIGEGLIVYHIDEPTISGGLRGNRVNAVLTPGLRLMEADGDLDMEQGRNRGDGNDPFPGALGRRLLDDDTSPSTRTFENRVTNIALRDVREEGDVVRFLLQVRPAGWFSPQVTEGPPLDPSPIRRAARTAGVDDQGMCHLVQSENIAGHAQVQLRSGTAQWDSPIAVSSTSAGATDPTLAVLPGGDLAIAWSDTRSGRAQIYYRSRIGGTWTAERPVTQLPGNCMSPAIAADGRGTISLAFQYLEGGVGQIRFMRFTYFSPFGQSVPITSPADQPSDPAVVSAFDGTTHIVWRDQSGAAYRLWFCRSHPDSGVSGKLPLTAPPTRSQLGYSVALDPGGALHSVWQTSSPGQSQLHYQLRSKTRPPEPADTLIESQGYPVQNPVLAVDADRNVHVAFEAAPNQVLCARYRLNVPSRGWDDMSTHVSEVGEGTVSRVEPMATGSGKVTVAYIQYRQDGAHFVVRRRDPALASFLEVPPAAWNFPSPLSVAPNPIRPGQSVDLTWASVAGNAPSAIEILDVAGRRLQGPIAIAGGQARISGSVTRAWAPGVYFVRFPSSRAGAARLVVLH